MTSTRDALLGVMDRKDHWAYPALTRPGLTRAQLFVHFRHEYLVYVRDFPVLLARTLGIVPPIEDVRACLARNLYEEQTGGISGTAAHPRLFLRMMAGLGFDPATFADDDAWLHPAALRYRNFLRERACAPPWQAALALLTIFVEGSVHERAELAGDFVRRESVQAVTEHVLVKHYGCPPEAMELTRAHAEVEGEHRQDAWRMVLAAVQTTDEARAAIDACERALAMWHAYRDGVAERMGVERSRAEAQTAR